MDKLKNRIEDNRFNLKKIAQKILNIAIYQIGEGQVKAYEEKFDNLNSHFKASYYSENLPTDNFRTLLPKFIQDKNIVIPILIYKIMDNSYGYNYFNSLLRVIENSKNTDDLNAYFKYYKSKDEGNILIEEFGPIHIIPKDWLLSAQVAEIIEEINSSRSDAKASEDLCYALESLGLENNYLDCM